MKRSAVIVAFALALLLPLRSWAGCSLPVDAATVGLWHCDEGTGVIVHDASGHGYDGTLSGGAGWGGSYCGESGVTFPIEGPRLTIPGAMNTATPQGTIEFAFMWDGDIYGNTDPRLFDQFVPASASNLALVLSQRSGGGWRLHFAIARDFRVIGQTAIQPGSTYRVACTWDGQSARIYLNGVLDGEGATSAIPEATTNPLLFAYNAGGADYPSQFVGVIDEIRFSDIARTPGLTTLLDIDPDVINLRSNGRWITAYLGGQGLDPASIDLSTLRLQGSMAPEAKPASIVDHDSDGAMELMVKFDRQALIPLLTPGVNHLTVTGSLVTGESFEATADVTAIDPGSGELSLRLISPAGAAPVRVVADPPSASERQVTVYDVQGRVVRAWSEPAGAGPIVWNGSTGRGPATSGVYWMRVTTPSARGVVKFVVAR